MIPFDNSKDHRHLKNTVNHFCSARDDDVDEHDLEDMEPSREFHSRNPTTPPGDPTIITPALRPLLQVSRPQERCTAYHGDRREKAATYTVKTHKRPVNCTAH